MPGIGPTEIVILVVFALVVFTPQAPARPRPVPRWRRAREQIAAILKGTNQVPRKNESRSRDQE
jgi:hypothetical protein